MKTPMTSLVQKSGYIGIALLCASGAITRAGDSHIDSKESKTVEPLTTDSGDPWKFTLAVPGWLANTSGTAGLNGINSSFYLGVWDLVPHIDMGASVSAEVRKGRFGMYGDLFYASASDGIGSNGLISKLDVRLDEYIADLELNYRVLEGPKGYLDVRAGVRYTNMFTHLSIAPNDYAIEQASNRLVDEVSKRIRSRVEDKLGDLDLKGKLRGALADRVAGVTDKLGGLRGERPTLPVAPIGGGRPGVIDEIIRAAIERRAQSLADALRAELAATTDRLREEARNRVNTLKKRLANEIANTLKSKLDASFNLTEYWFDPYVGLSGRYNLNKAWYLTAKGDIGGFGVGSKLTWQAYGALGCQVTRYIFLEAGYRYLYTDYNQNGFLYDTTMSGAQITAGITF